MLNCEIAQRNQQWRIWEHGDAAASSALHVSMFSFTASVSWAQSCTWLQVKRTAKPGFRVGGGLFVVSRQIRETPTARQQPPPTSSHYWLSCVAPAAPACCRSQHANSLHQAQHEQRSSWAGASHHFAPLETCKCQDLPSRAAAETRAPCHSIAPDG